MVLQIRRKSRLSANHNGISISLVSEDMKQNVLDSGLVFGLVVSSAVIYFEVNAGFLARREFVVLTAYVPAIIGAFLFGIRFGSWYEPIDGEKPYMELVLAPLAVISSSVAIASLTYSFTSLLVGGISGGFIKQFLTSALFPAIVFVIVTWHILFVGSALSSVYLGWRRKYF